MNSYVYEQMVDQIFLLKRETSGLFFIFDFVKAKCFLFANDLNQFLQATSNVVCIWKVLVLAFDLLRLVKA